jgi:hypothetical protein
MKIIINNQASISINQAIELVSSVVNGGHISGSGDKKQYCYMTIFKQFSPVACVSVTKNKNSQTFTIYDYRGVFSDET